VTGRQIHADDDGVMPESDTDLRSPISILIRQHTYFFSALLLNIDDDVSWMAAAPDSLDEGINHAVMTRSFACTSTACVLLRNVA
jgi:hypothetical protein